jgi:hypothetical protein
MNLAIMDCGKKNAYIHYINLVVAKRFLVTTYGRLPNKTLCLTTEQLDVHFLVMNRDGQVAMDHWNETSSFLEVFLWPIHLE